MLRLSGKSGFVEVGLIRRCLRVRVALMRYHSATHPPRCDPRGCHESRFTPHTLGKSPLCDGPHEVWGIIVITRPRNHVRWLTGSLVDLGVKHLLA